MEKQKDLENKSITKSYPLKKKKKVLKKSTWKLSGNKTKATEKRYAGTYNDK